MKRLLPLLLLFATPLFAATPDCSAYDHLGALYEIRSVMLRPYSSSYDVDRVIDQRVDRLRGPQADGSYRWVQWRQPSGDAPTEKKTHEVRAAQGSGDPDLFESSREHVFALKIVVPRKRSLLNGNNPVYVGNVTIKTTVDGRPKTIERPVNAWMNPDTSRTIDLDRIVDRAEVALEASVAAKDVKQAVVEVHYKQAVAQDDPENPAYETIRSLERIRGSYSNAYAIDEEIATAERALFPGANPIPLLSILGDLRHADDLMRSKKSDDYEKGERLLKDTLRKLR